LSSSNNNNNDNNNPFTNVVDNYLKYIENVEQTLGKDNWLAQKMKRVWMPEMVKHPIIFATCFSDNPALFEEAKREVATLLYEM
jgi:hypothetical protein